MEAQTGLSVLADQRGVLVVYPQGLAQPADGGAVGWDASGPADPQADGIDDGLFVSDVLTAVQAGYCVDPRRIAATGFSNGAGLVGYLACAMSGRVAGFAPVEAEFFQIPGGCRPARPASVLDVHVVSDPVAPYAGTPPRGSPDYYATAVPVWLGQWAARDGCRAQPRTALDSPAVMVDRWDGCDGGATVAAYRLTSGGHTWPARLGKASGSAAILDFFTAHPLPAVADGWTAHPADLVPALAAPPLAVASVREFRLPTRSAEPVDVARGPDGAVWFTEFAAGRIGRITPAGVITEFPVPTRNAEPYQLSGGPDGGMWFTEYNTARLGQVSATGRVTDMPMPRGSAGGLGITAAPGGRAWVADPAGFLDTITGAGVVTRIPLSRRDGTPFAVASQSAGSAWVSGFTGYFGHARALTLAGPSGVERTVTLPGQASNVDALSAGASGAVWFTDYGTGAIGELSPAGFPRLFPDPARYGGLNDITTGPDGALWFTEQNGLIGRMTRDGRFSELALPAAGSRPDGITAGPGRTIWIAETGADAIVRLTLR